MALTPEPVYLMLGDSIFNGEITPDIVADLKSDTLGATRSSIQKVWNRARRDSRLVLVDVEDLERSSADNIHENPLSSFESGRRLATAMRRLVR